ncbi:MAG: MoaD/ThiS family protein [Myxococcales bacterium]|nr:MoaD/ThiS family protein [Myxococcales bacterium]
MQVTLLCFSHLRQAFGKTAIELELADGATSADAEAKVREMLPEALRAMVFRVAVNQSVVRDPVPLSDGDEVAFLPPMQGG